MDRNHRALDLIGRIYEAAAGPARWKGVVEGLSQALEDAAVALAFERGVVETDDLRFVAGIDAETGRDCVDTFLAEVSRAPEERHAFARGFAFPHRFADRPIESSAFCDHWRKRRKLAAAWPMGHLIAAGDGRPVASIVAYRKEGGSPFSAGDLAFANQLVPHLERAFELHRALASVTHQHRAMAEVMNRLPTGVILVDRERHLIVSNCTADRLVGLGDGLSVSSNGLHAANPHDEAVLQRLLGEAIARARDTSPCEGLMAISRPSGKRAFPVLVTPLLDADPGGVADDAVAAVLLGDPDARQAVAPEVIRRFYDLTPAEVELVRLLAEGVCLEEAAKRRGVTINTVRSQLKNVFAKTDTSRQGELIRLVLTAAASFPEVPNDRIRR